MGEMVLSPLLQVIFDKLASPLLQKINDGWELKNNLLKLQQTLPRIQALLEDAEERQITDKAVRIWLSQLKDASDKAEDFLEVLVNSLALSRSSLLIHTGNLNRAYFCVNKLQETLKVLEVAAAEGLNLHLREGSRVGHRRLEGRETGSFVNDSEVYGRDGDKKKFVDLLLSLATPSDHEGNVSVIPIVGIGGIGKTSLAQLIYNDQTVVQHFEVRMWVFVSQDFNVKNIMKAAIVSATKSVCDISEIDFIQFKLWDVINRKKYLLVLDDVWNEDQEEWDKVWSLFQGGAKGSKVIITTRSKKVAMIMETCPGLTHRLTGLSGDDCWVLFRKRAFSRGEEDRYPNLSAIGRVIVKKCGGVPLAVKTLGSLLRFKREEKEWLFVRKSELWNLEACHQTGIIPALMLSYLHLPTHLKHCFAFCSLFPKNYEIKKEKLILIWMAAGLILPQGGIQTMEDVGDEYFNELSWMSFFEEVKDCSSDAMKRYKMNDLLYDLARSITRNDSIILDRGCQTSNLSHIHHLSGDWGSISCQIPETLYEAKHLRTLLVLFSGGKSLDIPPKMFLNLSYLRVLDLNGCDITILPDTLRDLQCLKYLDLSYTPIDQLPGGLSDVPSLQTLNLSGCINLNWLPHLGEMTNLRHLNIAGCESLLHMPSGFDKLLHLQTLPMYIVSRRASIGKLGSLKLRGEITIKHLENVRQVEEAINAKLMKKAHIHSLGLCWGYDNGNLKMTSSSEVTQTQSVVRKKDHDPKLSSPSRYKETDPVLSGEILSCLRPHENLKKLFIVGYTGLVFPQWDLPNLSLLVLKNCRGCVHLPSLGHLPLLNSLHMEGMDKVKGIGPEFYGEQRPAYFPSLEDLTIIDFPNLEGWFSMDGRNLYPRLSKFSLKKCPNLPQVPKLLSLHYLELQDCKPAILNFLKKSTLLSTLVIEDFPDLLSLPEELLSGNVLLESLKISSCPKLQSLPSSLQYLKSLKILTIRWCEALSSLPKGFHNLTSLVSLELTECHSLTTLSEEGTDGLCSLKTLSIENCRNLASLTMKFQHLKSLEHLTIMYCPSIVSLPDSLQHLSALRSLTIISQPELSFLPEGLKHVTALQSLEIRSCSNLSCLPEWFDKFTSLRSLAISDCMNVKCLPVAIRSLTALQHLSINQCPDLEKRCEAYGGVDFWKISQVPYKYISSARNSHGSEASSSST